MHIKKILLFIISFAFSQNINSFIWNGTSISTSDNIDALNLNPAGLGIKRDNQFGFIVQNIPVTVSLLEGGYHGNKRIFTICIK